MTFEERFSMLVNNQNITIGHSKNINNWFIDIEIEEHCLDKQRVKEAIEKVLGPSICNCSPLVHCLNCYGNQLKKELKL